MIQSSRLQRRLRSPGDVHGKGVGTCKQRGYFVWKASEVAVNREAGIWDRVGGVEDCQQCRGRSQEVWKCGCSHGRLCWISSHSPRFSIPRRQTGAADRPSVDTSEESNNGMSPSPSLDMISLVRLPAPGSSYPRSYVRKPPPLGL